MSGPCLALDLGGTKTAAGVVTPDGVILARARVPTPELRAGGDPLTALIGLGREVLARAAVAAPAGVGLALPGPVDPAAARLLAAPTLPELEGVPLAPALAAAFGCPAAGENDANACALAESRWGAGAGLPSLGYFTVSTGIGGGFVADGRIFRGATGTAAEFGHQVILPEGPPCACGGRGCLEALASGGALGRRGASLGHADAAALAAAARAGDPRARALWEDAALHLGLGVSNVVNLLDPAVVVLGGGVALGAADLLLESVRAVVRERCMPRLARPTPVVLAALGEDLGLLSAAATLSAG